MIKSGMDPLAETHDFALVNNGAVYVFQLATDHLDALATEARSLSTAAILVELWHPDSWELKMVSFADSKRNDDLSVTPDLIPFGLDADAGFDRVRAAQEQVRSQQLNEPPWAMSRLSGRGTGWIRVALPEGTTPPQELTVWTEDGWYPISGRVRPAPNLHGMSTLWYQPDEHSSGCHITFSAANPGQVLLVLTLSPNLLGEKLDLRPATAKTASGIELAAWRRAQQAMTAATLDRLGWSVRGR